MSFMDELETILEQRKNADPKSSYTAKLYSEGIDRILRKVGEEAGEVIIAAKNNDNEELKNEVADLLFHLLVLLKKQNLSFKDVEMVLQSRHKK